MKPYYTDETMTIYCGNAQEILPTLSGDMILADPPYKSYDYVEWFADARKLTERIILTPGTDHIAEYPQPKWIICWHKPSGTGHTRIGGFSQWEPVLVYGTGCHFPQDYFYQVPLNFSQGPEKHHPWPKPLSLWKWLIEHSTKPGETVIDPFLGSGTTCVAAKSLGRKAIGIEIEEKYCHIAVERLRQEVMEFSL